MVEDRLAAFLRTMSYHRTTLDYPKNDNPFYSQKSSMGTPYNRYNMRSSHLLGLLHYHAQSDEGQVPLRLLPLLDRVSCLYFISIKNEEKIATYKELEEKNDYS